MIRSIVLLIVAVALASAGCGEGDDNGDETPATTEPAATATTAGETTATPGETGATAEPTAGEGTQATAEPGADQERVPGPTPTIDPAVRAVAEAVCPEAAEACVRDWSNYVAQGRPAVLCVYQALQLWYFAMPGENGEGSAVGDDCAQPDYTVAALVGGA